MCEGRQCSARVPLPRGAGLAEYLEVLRSKHRSPLAVVQGALLTWAAFRKGTARNWIAKRLDPVLEPFVSP